MGIVAQRIGAAESAGVDLQSARAVDVFAAAIRVGALDTDPMPRGIWLPAEAAADYLEDGHPLRLTAAPWIEARLSRLDAAAAVVFTTGWISRRAGGRAFPALPEGSGLGCWSALFPFDRLPPVDVAAVFPDWCRS